MSFQGDVRGIGLAELLQGLARGRKEGTLTLSTKSGLHGSLGLLDGQAYLLPSINEDPETWRVRIQDAWGPRGEEQFGQSRLTDIARAERLEGIYRLLDGEGVHFRFEPGTLPQEPKGIGESAGLGSAISVEILLLEYARISDELAGSPAVRDLPSSCIPVVMDPVTAEQSGCAPNILAESDGKSTFQEIADRVGLPIRATLLAFAPALMNGSIRVASAAEMIFQALDEIQGKQYTRGSSRLEHWCTYGPPGPVPPEVAERLSNEWMSGRLPAAIRTMSARSRRTLLRRMDHSIRNTSQSVVHWIEATRLDTTDLIARLKRMVAEFKEGSNPDRPNARDLLDFAREMREAGNPKRATPALVMAANQQPSGMLTQMELGVGLFAAGRITESAPWILAGAEQMINQGQADRVLAPLRNLLEADPRNREARTLAGRAKRLSSSTRKMRRMLLAGLSLVMLASLSAAWKLRKESVTQDRLAEIRGLIHQPEVARAKIEEYFADEMDGEMRVIRKEIIEYERLIEDEIRERWILEFEKTKEQCTEGDPAVALEMIRELPPHPRLKVIKKGWPQTRDLYVLLADRLYMDLEGLGEATDGAPQQVHGENVLEEQSEVVIVTLLAQEAPSEIRTLMLERMEDLQDRISRRRKSRDAIVAERVQAENRDRQDELYLLGQEHEKNDDFERAEKCFEEVQNLDDTGATALVIAEDLLRVRRKKEAVQNARDCAHRGDHDEAYRELNAVFDDSGRFMLPYRVDSFPSGAKVTVESGRTYTTPFTIESTDDQEIEMVISMNHFMERKIIVGRPQNQLVYLDREPERSWRGEGRVDAIPVSVDGDHIIVSRHGEIARIGPDGAVRWKKTLRSLSGLARAPVFMARRPGDLLAVTEDGEAWIVDSATGHLEGPWQLGSAPVAGPAPNAGAVAVRLADDRVVEWSEVLRPDSERHDFSEDFGGGYRYGSPSGFQVARRRAGDPGSLQCPFKGLAWTITVEEDAFVVHPINRKEDGYSVVRYGDWEFIGWEAPSGHAPMGRAWVSDEAGVRAFIPPNPNPR